MTIATEGRAERLHAAVSITYWFSAVPEASFERREGHSRLLFPSVPFRLFNGIFVESEPCAGISESIREVEDFGVPCGVQVLAGRHLDVEQEAAELGLTEQTEMPGMAVAPDELADVRVPALEIVRVVLARPN